MIILRYLRSPRKKIFTKCKHCVTHKMCKTNQSCNAQQLLGDSDAQIREQKKGQNNKNKRQKKAS